jgi:hypothetical protein
MLARRNADVKRKTAGRERGRTLVTVTPRGGLIRARLRGAFVPDALRGRVVSRHERALNMEEEGSGLLVSLLLDAADMTGMGVVVALLPEGLGPGDGVCMTWGETPAWDGRLAPGGRPRRRVLGWLREALALHGVRGGLVDLLSRSDGDAFCQRAREVLASASLEEPDTLRGLEAFVGLGPGFTPSGDDFLTGALLAERWLGGRGPLLDRGAIGAALARTTPGGRTLLWLALRDSYPAYLLRFVERARAASTRRNVEEAVREAADHGETSGTDALAGLLWGCGGLEPTP